MHAAIGFGLVVTVALAALEYGLSPTLPRSAGGAPGHIISAGSTEYSRLPANEPAGDQDPLSWIARTVAVAEARVVSASSAVANVDAVPVPAPYPDRSSARQSGFSTPTVALLDVTAPSSGLLAKPVTALSPATGGKIERMASAPPADIASASKSVTTHSPDITKAGLSKAGRSKPKAAKPSKAVFPTNKGGPNNTSGTRPPATNPPKVRAAARPIKPASETSAATALTVLRSDPGSTQVSLVKPKLPLH